MQDISFTPEDLKDLEHRGIALSTAQTQLRALDGGLPYLDLVASASLEYGIVSIPQEDQAAYMQAWEDFVSRGEGEVYKMVPASGAASRMFKMLYSFLNAPYGEPQTEQEQIFFAHLQDFAFYDRLNEVCLRNLWKTIPKLLSGGEYKAVVEQLLLPKGMNYGGLPKGLLQFHTYPKGSCTAAEEHLAEGALYIRNDEGDVNIHFTVSPEHRKAFEQHIKSACHYYEDKYGVRYHVTYSEQKPSSDTLALGQDGLPFRTEDGKLLFRPGGHGALISNLGELQADVVFIKNIDNVTPDYLKGTTILYKKLLGGVLVTIRQRIYDYLNLLDKGKVSDSKLKEMVNFLSATLCIDTPSELLEGDEDKLQEWLYLKLHRPLRVCGMVRNEGEPGGGPFVVRESDGSTSLQILESSQIDLTDDRQRSMLTSGAYFNPVDLVCALTDHRGSAYHLPDYVNPQTAFISSKSLGGKELKALELPGLWNGAMHHWNTIFVEVPADTFTPVKEVNDLLRPVHQPCK